LSFPFSFRFYKFIKRTEYDFVHLFNNIIALLFVKINSFEKNRRILSKKRQIYSYFAQKKHFLYVFQTVKSF